MFAANSKITQLQKLWTLYTYMAQAITFATIRMVKTREHLRKVLMVTDNVTPQRKNCPSSAFGDAQAEEICLGQ